MRIQDLLLQTTKIIQDLEPGGDIVDVDVKPIALKLFEQLAYDYYSYAFGDEFVLVMQQENTIVVSVDGGALNHVNTVEEDTINSLARFVQATLIRAYMIGCDNVWDPKSNIRLDKADDLRESIDIALMRHRGNIENGHVFLAGIALCAKVLIQDLLNLFPETGEDSWRRQIAVRAFSMLNTIMTSIPKNVEVVMCKQAATIEFTPNDTLIGCINDFFAVELRNAT